LSQHEREDETEETLAPHFLFGGSLTSGGGGSGGGSDGGGGGEDDDDGLGEEGGSWNRSLMAAAVAGVSARPKKYRKSLGNFLNYKLMTQLFISYTIDD